MGTSSGKEKPHLEKKPSKLLLAIQNGRSDFRTVTVDTSGGQTTTSQWWGTGYSCDMCQGVIEGDRYECTSCSREESRGSSYDLCKTCYETKFKNCPHYGHKFSVEQIYNHKKPDVQDCCAKSLKTSFTHFGWRRFIGTRMRDPSTGEITDELQWMTFSEMYERSLNFAFGLHDQCKIKSWDFLGICARNSVEWVIADFGMVMRAVVTVPIHFSLEDRAIAHIINHTELKAIVCTEDLTATLLRISKECPLLEFIIEIEDVNNDLANVDWVENDSKNDPEEKVSDVTTNVKVIKFSDVEGAGKELRDNMSEKKKYDIVCMKPDDMITLIFTSGSSGTPKGAIITDGLHNLEVTRSGAILPHVVMCFQPLAHSSARHQVLGTLGVGGQLGMHLGGMDTLLDGMKILRPTMVSSTPALWNNIASQYHLAIKQAEVEFQEKYGNDEKEEHKDELEKARYEVVKRFRLTFGNRLKLALTGGAATSAAVKDLMCSLLGVFLVEGYGTTETRTITRGDFISYGVDVVLIDVPELGYFASDDPPRGEICAHTQRLVPGYYKEDKLTENAFIERNGRRYFRTGDIGERSGDKRVRIIDRLKFIFKLAQGEFIAPEPLEQFYEESMFIHQMFMSGNVSRSYTVAVLVPIKDAVLHWAQKESSLEETDDFDAICLTEELKQKLLSELRRIGKDKMVQAWEIPQAIYVEPVPFAMEKNLLTPSFKKKRLALSKKYDDIIEGLYTPGMNFSSSNQDTDEERHNYGFHKIPELGFLISDILQSLGHDISESGPLYQDLTQRSFAECGMDSLALARTVNMIKERFRVDLSIPVLIKLEPLRLLEDYVWSRVFRRSSSIPIQITEAEVATDWKSECELPNDFPSQLPSETSGTISGDILLTGATGFLGCFLLADILRHKSYEGKNVFCLIRDKNAKKANTLHGIGKVGGHNRDDSEEKDMAPELTGEQTKQSSAFERLQKQMKDYKVWDPKFESRILVKVGDLEKYKFGLSEKDYGELAESVSVIFHNGSMVNSILPYSSHRAANVEGTISVLRLAFEEVPKEVHYVSTISVLPRRNNEKEAQIEYLNEFEGNFPGYGQSKRISEFLIYEAVKRGLNAQVYRPSTISGHTITGSGNKLDFINLLICGIITVGVYPQDCAGLPPGAQLVPVNYVSGSIVHISQRRPSEEQSPPNGCPVYHLVPKESIRFSELIRFVKSFGIVLREVSPEEWKNTLMNMKESNPMYLFRERLMKKRAVVSDPPNDKLTRKSIKSQKQLAKMFVSEKTFHKYLNDFLDCGLISRK